MNGQVSHPFNSYTFFFIFCVAFVYIFAIVIFVFCPFAQEAGQTYYYSII